MKKLISVPIFFFILFCLNITALGGAFTNYNLNPGESITVMNSSSSNYYISISGSFDYVVYDEDGSAYEKSEDEASTSHFAIYHGKRTVITNISKSAYTVSGASELFKPQASENPALRTVELEQNQSVEFTNENKLPYWVRISGSFDYIIYDEDGSVYEDDQGCDATRVFKAEPGKRTVVTNVDKTAISITGAYELFIPTESANSSIDSYSLESGCSTLIYNDSKFDFNIAIEGSFDYVVYDEDGSAYDYGRNNDSTKVFKIYKNKRTIITNISKASYAISGPSELFLPLKYTDSAFFDAIIKPEESLSFTNENKFPVFLKLDNKFDYVKYDEDGSVYDSYRNGNASSVFKAETGKRTIITNINKSNLTVSGPSELFYPIKWQYSAFNKVILKPGESIQYLNNNSFNVALNIDGLHDYVVYDEDNSLYDSGQNKAATKVFTSYKGTRVVITNSDKSEYTVCGAYELFKPTVSSSEPVKPIKKLEPKETGDTKKQWVIRFNKPIDLTLFTKYYLISVTDAADNSEISCNLQAGNDSKSIRILPPASGYNPGHTYIITISAKDSSAKLDMKTQMQFKIKGNTPDSSVSSIPVWVENSVSFVKDGAELYRDEKGIYYPRVSPDKKSLLYVNETGDKLLIADFSTKKINVVYDLPIEYSDGFSLMPSGWSADSTKVLFTIFADGGLSLGGNNLIEVAADGSAYKTIRQGVGHADWSVNGNIVYSYSSDMKIIDENGIVKQTVNTPDYSVLYSADMPSFSPDGKKLVYCAGSDYFIHDVDKNTYEKITDKDIYNSTARITNDGQIIFDYADAVYIYSPSKDKVELYYNKAKCSFPDWW